MAEYLDKSGLSYFWSKIKNYLSNFVPSKSKKSEGIFYGKLDSTSTSTVMTAQIPGITELKHGVHVMLVNDVVSSASGFTLNINNLGAKPVYSSMASATRITTAFNIAYTWLFVYDENRVTGGCWVAYYGYYTSPNTTGYLLRGNYAILPTKDKFYRYRICFTSPDGEWIIPSNTSTSTNATALRDVTQRPINPFGRIFYYSTTAAVEAGNKPSASYMWDQYYFTLGYSFNRTGSALVLEVDKPIYLKCAPQLDGSAIIDATTPYVQDLPSSEDGKIYIFLGYAYSETQIEMYINHPIYYYKNGYIRPWTNSIVDGDLILNGGTSTEVIYGTS